MIGLTPNNLSVQRLMEKQNLTLTNLRFPQNLLSKFTLQEAEGDQQELKILIDKLNNNYNPKNQIKIK